MNNTKIVRKHTSSLFLVILLSICGLTGYAQEETLYLTLDDVIAIARDQSPMAIMARHRFRGSYWEYRTHKAKFRPGLNLDATLPDLTRSIDKITLDDGSDAFVERSLASYSVGLGLTQNIAPTGGSIFMRSELERIDRFNVDEGRTNYLSTPVSIGISQPIKAHNSFRWEKKIEPLKYEAAMKSYIESLEQVNQQAVNRFFNLALAQVNIQIAEQNYSNNDTLYKISQGRYNIGTIAENELLQMELAFLNAGTDLNEARIQLEINKYELRSFLGYNENVDLRLIIPETVPELDINVSRALEEAYRNSPTIIDLEREMLEADKSVAQARAEKGLTADLYATYGLTQQADDFYGAYQNTQDQERLRIGIELPIVDWGLGKGRYRMAQSNQEVVRTNVQQAKIDFDQQVMLQVMQFNLQDDQLRIAAKADTVAQKRYNVTKERFYIGKIDVLELNIALGEKDAATRSYLSAMKNYWSYFYNIRRLTLYDWQRMQPLDEDFESLIQ